MTINILKVFLPMLSSMLFFSCGVKNSGTTENTQGEKSAEEIPHVSPSYGNINAAVSSQLSVLVESYIDIKNAMIKSDAVATKSSAQNLLHVIDSVDLSKFTAEQKTTFNSQAGKLKVNLKLITEADDIGKQREQMNSLTEAMYTLVQSFGAGKPLYYEFCPMANDNKGGYWLSESKEVTNPYFGDEMLHCGEVKAIVE